MKKIFYFLLICFIPIIFTNCSCNIKTATTFNSKSIINSYNNYLAGGKIAYVNNNLYVTYISNDYINLGTYKFNDTGISQVMGDVSKIGSYAVETPSFYQFNDNLYVVAEEIFTYDEVNDKLRECQCDYITPYFTNDLKVGWKENMLTVSYKDNPDFVIEEAHTYYVDDYKIYFTNTDGWLYFVDVTKGSSPEFLSYLSESPLKLLHVCDDKVYFDCDSEYNDKFKTGLYCYNVEKGNCELILEGTINRLNSYNNVLYIATDDGIFNCKNNKVSRIINRSAKTIYLLDEEWIYAVQNDAGNVYRVSLDGKMVEIVDFMMTERQGMVRNH